MERLSTETTRKSLVATTLAFLPPVPKEAIKSSAHACSENGVKWFLFLFFDLRAVLRFASLSGLLAVPAFLESAEVFEATER
jgi:hypothetical protein